MNAKHHVARIAVLGAALAIAAPAFADPPQLRIDAPTHQGAPDGWAPQYADDGSGAAAHPDNNTRYVPAPVAEAVDTGNGLDWRAAVLVSAFGLAAAGTIASRLRTRPARA